ncbi:Mediator of DNA damage checkpoint protein 1 [Coemansia sp. RSA 1722]|nr:Mediator of DNA damage checkpoint protein 1 [Coemansia sp. RSA 485]KAJ2592231.1 Mediator of DNA damage checkpoint protein 1 [Coemansia sp. RSA 1722]KAJ2601232.1 Mediator of DNA damage checkpoint protein 1 [Coemansia sp. RSA 1721]
MPYNGRGSSAAATSPASSVATQPYNPNDTAMLVQSSPISADKLYTKHDNNQEPATEPRISAILYKRVSDSDSDDPLTDDGPLNIHLFSGTNLIGQQATAVDPHVYGGGGIVNEVMLDDRSVRVVIEIDEQDGLYVLSDCGSAAGVYLGHRRTRVRPGIRYFLTDGKLVRLGSRCFWFHILATAPDACSRSPSPPWNIRSYLADTVAGSTATLAAVDAKPSSSSLRPSLAARRAVVQPGRLRRETPAATVATVASVTAAVAVSAAGGLSNAASTSPLFANGSPPPLFLLGSPDPKEFGLTQMVSYGAADFGDMDCALSDTQPTCDFSPEMADADDLSSMVRDDTDDEITADTPEPTSGRPTAEQLFGCVSLSHTQPMESQPRLLTQDSHYQAPSQLSYSPDASMRISGLRVAESPRVSPLPLPRSSPSMPNLTSGPSQLSQEMPVTQPASPGRLPPNDNVQQGEKPTETSYLPQPSALVYAPSRVVLAAADQAPATPRYPYDFEGLDTYLRALAECTPSTQSDPDAQSSDDGPEDPITASAIAASGDVALSSDFSQHFLSPPQLQQQQDQKEYENQKQQPIHRPVAKTSRNRGRLLRHRRSIDHYTDSGSSSESDSSSPSSRTAPPSARTQSASSIPSALRPATNFATPSQRFGAKPLGMSARPRMRPQPQLKLQSSGNISTGSLTAAWPTSRAGLRTPDVLSVTGRGSRSAAAGLHHSAVHTPYRSGATTPVSGVTALMPAADGFPDDSALAPPLTASSITRSTQQQNRVLRTRQKQRRHTQGFMSSLSATHTVDSDLGARLPTVLSSVKRRCERENPESSGEQDTPTRSRSKPVMPGRVSTEMLYSSDEAGERQTSDDAAGSLMSIDVMSSPQLPHPSMLLQSRSADDTPQKPAETPVARDVLPPSRIPRLHLRCRDPVNDENLAAGAEAGWINVDHVRTPERAATNAVAGAAARGGAKTQQTLRGRGAASAGARRPASVTPTGRGSSLRETLRKLPGVKGVGRTGLTSKRRSTLRSVRATLNPDHEASPLTKRNDSASTKAPSSSDNLSKPVAVAIAATVPAVSDTTSTPATVQPRLTRQQSNGMAAHTSGIESVMFTGFDDSELRDRMSRTLESQGLRVTDDPLLADICVSSQRLSRTLKVLCAIGRGIPIVAASWLSHPPPLTLALASSHLLSDPTTEAEWGMSLQQTLDTTRALNESRQPGARLLGSFCVYVARDVENPSPKSLCTMVRAAGGHILNDVWTPAPACAQKQQSLTRAPSAASTASMALKQQVVADDDQCCADNASRRSISRAMSMDVDGLTNAADSSSSTEPDDDSDDEDWTIETAASRRLKSRAAKKPLLSKRNSSSTQTKQQPLVIESPGVLADAAAGFADALSEDPDPDNKRRRVEAGPGTDGLLLDPHCGSHDMDYFLSARKAELQIPEDTRLLVITAAEDPEVQQKWAVHQATVVLPEQIIQSIIHCRLMF